MTDFLIKSSISLLVLLLFYHMILEKEKMHQFNRYFLLVSLFFSLTVPFVSFEIHQEIPVLYNKVIQKQTITADNLSNQIEVVKITAIEETNYLLYYVWFIYISITLVLSFRFIRNIYKITSKAKGAKVIKQQDARLVLLTEETLPYTFWNSIYINQRDYENSQIEQELFTHEIAHVKQKHTIDVIFVEILKTWFWFNPIFILYKKAIQLNHEFLADENVLSTHRDISFYQNLLLNKIGSSQPFILTSNFNFLAIKKRLIMMTKNTSKAKATLMKFALLVLFIGLTTTLCAQFYSSKESKPQLLQAEKTTLIDAVAGDVEKDSGALKGDGLEINIVESIANQISSLKDIGDSQLLEDKKIIVIDPGHGGKDTGSYIGTDEVVQEKKIVENIANKIKLLNRNGELEIILLREDDSFIELSERVSKINKINPSLLISLHVNASKNKNENGVYAFVSKENAFYEQSKESAKNIIDKISNEKLAKGEVKDGPFYVITRSKCPALLVEVGYLSNENDRAYLISENGQNEIANKIFEFIKM